MYCKYCGQPLDERAMICPHCGVATDNASLKMTEEDDRPSGGFAVLSFFVPLVGLILYLVWHDNYPKKARSCGKGALIGVIVGAIQVVLSIVVFFFSLGIAANVPAVSAACCAFLL